MKSRARFAFIAVLLIVLGGVCSAAERVALTFDTSEAEAVLAILSKRNTGVTVTDADWQRLFAARPYIRLKEREASMKRDFTDEDFKKFLLADETMKRASELQKTLDAWKRADLNAAAERILLFLPADAVVRAKIFPVIKPKENSFVFDVRNDASIFFYLNPEVSAESFENTAAHELHHIGYASVEKRYDSEVKKLPENVRPAAEWLGAFGEGLAMLAAAGSAEVHPHRFSKAEDRARWDRDMSSFSQELRTVDEFLLNIIHGKFASKDEINKRGFEFFGVQGPWYTVGYRMAAAVEEQLGRDALLACTDDPRKLLATWNALAAKQRQGMEEVATWSPELLAALQAEPVGRKRGQVVSTAAGNARRANELR